MLVLLVSAPLKEKLAESADGILTPFSYGTALVAFTDDDTALPWCLGTVSKWFSISSSDS